MKRLVILGAALCLPMFSSLAQENPSTEVFARIGDVVLTQELLDHAFTRIPEEHRLAFIRDSKKVDQLVKQILTNMILADQARAAGFDQQPHIASRMKLAVNKTLMEAWLDEQVKNTPEPDFEALAREFYVLNPDQFLSSPTYDVTHLLIKTDTRSAEEARQIAEQLREEALAHPERFDALVREHSEARDVAQLNGRLVGLEPGQTVPAFEEAANALDEPGDISEVVETAFGYHVIRLDRRKPPEKIPFEDVRGRLIAARANEFRAATRNRIVTEAVSVAPLEFPEGAIEKMLRRHFGEDLELAPAQQR